MGSRLAIMHCPILASAFPNILHFAHGMLADRGAGRGYVTVNRESTIEKQEAQSRCLPACVGSEPRGTFVPVGVAISLRPPRGLDTSRISF